MARGCVASLLIAVCLAAGCGKDKDNDKDKDKDGDKKTNEDLIIGKWEATKKEGDVEMKMTVEFMKDGKLKMGIVAGPVNMAVDGTYKWADKDTLETTMKDPTGKGKMEKTEKVKVLKLDDKELELKGETDKEPQKFTRVK